MNYSERKSASPRGFKIFKNPVNGMFKRNIINGVESVMYVSSESNQGENPSTNIKDLKPGMENVSVKARVLSSEPPHVIQTKKGPRTISNAVIGDSTGRVEVTAWGEKAGQLTEGEAVEIKGGWTTEFRGKVQLNIGRTTEVKKIDDSEVPQAEEIPEEMPTAPESPRPQGFRRTEGYRGPRRGGFRRREE